MPLRNQDKYRVKIDGELEIVTEIRNKILDEFGDLEFVEDGHKYFLNGEQLPSVSEIVHGFSQYPFHEEEEAIKYAEKHGETPQYWLDKWKFTNLKATVTGTQVHSFLESVGWARNGFPELINEDQKYKYIQNKNWMIPTRGKEEAGLKFFDELHPNLHFVMPETRVYSNKSELSSVKTKFCGTFDLLMYYNDPNKPSKSGLVILDWKTNKELTKEFSREYDKRLIYPFNSLYDEPLGFYSVQLNLYALCLYGIGFNVVGLRVIWLKEDGTYELIPIKPMFKEKWFKDAI